MGSLNEDSARTSKEFEASDGVQTPPLQEVDLEAAPIQTSKESPSSDQYLVSFPANDPEDPRNFGRWKKYWITFQLGMLALAASMGSSITAPATNTIAAYTGVSGEVAILQISFYILGFAFGPLCWAPISEIWGRRWSMLPALFLLGIFSIGTAVSRSAAAIFITRFLAGLVGSAPVSNVSAALGDIYAPKSRGTATTFYSIAVVGGPTLGPIIGSALLVNPHLGWRWTEYIEAIWAFSIAGICFFTLPELYAPVLLHRKAQRLRAQTGDDRYHHPHEDLKLDFKTIVTKHFTRPLNMLITEPLVTAIAFYASFVYGLLYLTLEIFPIVFEQNRHMRPVPSSFPFLGLFVGVLAASFINIANQPRYHRAVDAAGGKPAPEARMPPVIIGGIIFAIGLFWFGWTATPSISIWSPIIAAGFIGCGFNIIFNQCINTLVDTYGLYAASAVSANTFLRSILAAAFPLIARPMFNGLGVGPAMSILGGVATAMIAVPFLFLRFGLELRKKSKFAPYDD